MSGAELVEVAFANDPVEAGMMQGLLEEGGIRSHLRPTGPDGPGLGIELLPPSPQHVMVRADQAAAARSLLGDVLVEQEQEADVESPRSYGLIGAYARIWLWSLAAVGVAFGLFLLARIW